MHSSRMLTVRCSGRLCGGVCLGYVCQTPLHCEQNHRQVLKLRCGR